MESMEEFISSIHKRFHYYENVGIHAIRQMNEKDLFWHYNAESNSISIIVNHLHGNILSRWTNFFTEDGEKPWRDRDAAFTDSIKTKAELFKKWEIDAINR